jgi:hypothetical protein
MGWYKGIEHNPWGGLPEVLYPDMSDDFMSLTVIEIDADQMARIRFDAQTIMNENSGEPRLAPPRKPEWASRFAQDLASGKKVPTVADLEPGYEGLRHAVLSEVASLRKAELKAFLSDRIQVVLPSIGAVRTLRRTEKLPPPEYLHEEKLMQFLMQHPPRNIRVYTLVAVAHRLTGNCSGWRTHDVRL